MVDGQILQQIPMDLSSQQEDSLSRILKSTKYHATCVYNGNSHVLSINIDPEYLCYYLTVKD